MFFSIEDDVSLLKTDSFVFWNWILGCKCVLETDWWYKLGTNCALDDLPSLTFWLVLLRRQGSDNAFQNSA